MDARNEFLRTLKQARDVAARAAMASANDEKAARRRATECHRRMLSSSEEAERRMLGPSWANGRIGKAVWSFVAFRLWKLAWRKSIPALRSEATRAGQEFKKSDAAWRRYRDQRLRLSRAVAALDASARQAEGFGPMPAAIKKAAKATLLRLRGLKGHRRSDRNPLADCATSVEKLTEQWRETERSIAMTAVRRSEAVTAPETDAPAASLRERIYLPIPYAMGKYARAAGARYDQDAPRGSKWYIPIGEPLSRFQSFLPLAYRQTPPDLSFPPVRHGASSQNLWSLFDPMTWNSIRHINYERTGRRCMLCGKQSGNLLRYLERDGERRHGTVDCHEVWDWSVPDPETSIGIQKLKGLMILCFECHMCFHSGFARTAARRHGVEMEEKVRRFLMQRRAFLTRKAPMEVAVQMKDEASRLRGHAGVKLWIIDLSHLAGQDYMRQRQVNPVFVEDNRPGVKPGQVAGLSFVTDRGDRWPAVSADEIHASVADLYRTLPPEGFLARLSGR